MKQFIVNPVYKRRQGRLQQGQGPIGSTFAEPH